MNLTNTITTAQKERMHWLDYDKGITILLVGYGHCLASLTGNVTNLDKYPFFTYIGTFLYGFRMPLFFIISGILVGGNLQKKGLLQYIVSRIDLFYAMLVWGILEITLKLLSHSPTVSYWSYLHLFIDPRQTGHFWYLNALCCIGILYSIVKTKAKLTWLPQIAIGLVLYTVSAYLLVNNIRAGFLADICKFYFFFALGDAISVWVCNEKTQQKLATWKLFLPLFILFFGIQYYCTSINLQHPGYGNFYVENTNPALYFAEAMIGCATSMSFSFLLQKHHAFRWLKIIGSYSLYIYLMQMIVLSFARTFLEDVFHLYTPVLIISLWMVGTILPILLYKLMMRLGLRWLFSFRKPESKFKVIILARPLPTKKIITEKASNKTI